MSKTHFAFARPLLEVLEDRVMLDHKGFPHGGGGGGGGNGGGGGDDPSTTVNPAFVFRQYNKGGGNDLYLINADGSGKTRLTDTDSFTYTSPEWSPDGSKIAFIRQELIGRGSVAPPQLFTINPDGTNLTLLNDFSDAPAPSSGSPGNGDRFAWSPDAAWIGYFSDADGDFAGPNDLIILNVATGAVSVLVEDLQVTGVANPLVEAFHAAWSPDLDADTNGYQGKILFGGWDGVTAGDSALYTLDVVFENGTIRTGEVNILIDEPGEQDRPAWSPDGGSIVYMTNHIDLGYAIKKLTVEHAGTGLDVSVTVTGNEVLLNPNAVDDFSVISNSALTWSPDSQWVGFHGGRTIKGHSYEDLFRIRPDGTNLTNVTFSDKIDEVWMDWNTAWINDIDGALHAESMGTSASADTLTISQAESLVTEAVVRWEMTGADTSALANVEFVISDLSGTTLGQASGNTIFLDSNAAGWGWFVDPTPWVDSEFTTPGDQGEQNRMDLLTVITHELGHILGYEHEEDGVMVATLAAGERHMMDFDSSAQWEQALFALAMTDQSRQ